MGYNPPINGVVLGVITPLILTIDPNFQRDILVAFLGCFSSNFWTLAAMPKTYLPCYILPKAKSFGPLKICMKIQEKTKGRVLQPSMFRGELAGSGRTWCKVVRISVFVWHPIGDWEITHTTKKLRKLISASMKIAIVWKTPSFTYLCSTYLRDNRFTLTNNMFK